MQSGQVGASSHYSYQFDRDQITVTIKGLAGGSGSADRGKPGGRGGCKRYAARNPYGRSNVQLGAAYELVSCDPLQIIVHDRTEESKESMETESQAETEEESASASEQS